ncbi:MAG: hypothetical protein ACI4F8_08495 [Lachnospiraceae bacterium]
MKSRKILKNKYYLYATEFFAGMSVMAVELLAEQIGDEGLREMDGSSAPGDDGLYCRRLSSDG